MTVNILPIILTNTCNNATNFGKRTKCRLYRSHKEVFNRRGRLLEMLQGSRITKHVVGIDKDVHTLCFGYLEKFFVELLVLSNECLEPRVIKVMCYQMG